MRSRRASAAAMATFGLLMPALVPIPALASAALNQVCAGRTVTIDLTHSGAPNPRRPASDVVSGTPASDTIRTGRGNDIVCGGRGDDTIDLGPGDDAGYGQYHQDSLTGGPGRDRLDGGRGEDTVVYRGAPRGVRVDLRITGPQDSGWGRDTIVNVGSIVGSPYDDVLRRSGRSGVIIGLAGHDLVEGGRGSDELNGGPGNDTLLGGPGPDYFERLATSAGADTIYGGPGQDDYWGATPGDHYEGGGAGDFMRSTPCSPCDAQFIELIGGDGHDKFLLQRANERVDGGSGVDYVSYRFLEDDTSLTIDLTITGPQGTGAGGTDDLTEIEDLVGVGEGENQLSGNDADNTILGGYADDMLVGRGGDDYLYGDIGVDTCDGGAGMNQVFSCEAMP